MVCKQLEHVLSVCLRQVWDNTDWLYEGQHGFRLGYSCERKVVTVCQDIAESLEEGVGIHAIIIDFSKVFDLVPFNRLLTKLGLGRGFEGSRLGKGIPCSSYKKGKSSRATIQESQSNLRCAARERFRPINVSSVRK